ncbi:hypothetical protein GCM10020220_068000 [Nonomuraea rubra]
MRLAMVVVSAPVLGARLSGESGPGALLLAVIAAGGLVANAVLSRTSRWAAGVQAAGTAVLGAGVVVMACAETYWMAVVGAAVAGAGEGPQLTALFAVRHREAPARLRGQVFTTGASLKITSFAIGSAAAGPLAAYDVSLALLAGAALQAAGRRGPRRQAAGRPGRMSAPNAAGTPAANERRDGRDAGGQVRERWAATRSRVAQRLLQ